ncbi:MAG TPA: hypothetical protein VNZ45_11150 [Bacteroidia bacterium]|nr:hypothetical protein [Bacteroidia bacterium]
MKKLSVILAALVLFAGVSFASPVVKTKSTKQTTEKKAPAKKTPKKASTATKGEKKAATPAPAAK